MKKFYFILFIALAVMSCRSLQVHFSTVEDIQRSVTPKASTLPAYDLTGGVWVQGQPLFINQDFDFSMAIALLDIGPAIAAGNRIKGNKEAAKLFEGMPKLGLQRYFDAALKAAASRDRNKLLKNKDSVKLYGILFGQPKAHLRVILEIDGNRDEKSDKPLRFIYVTDWLPLKGENSWSSNNGQKLRASFQATMPVLIEMLMTYDEYKESPEIQYSVIGGKVPQRGSGWVLARGNGRILIKSKDIPNTILSYPESVIEVSTRPDGIPHPQGGAPL